MCGIAGYWTKHTTTDLRPLANLSWHIARRGPDGAGYFFGGNAEREVVFYGENIEKAAALPHHVGLAHRRYAVLDRSAGGAQPMQRGALTIVFNGEIYNYVALRDELRAAGHTFQTASDTEVLLAAWQHWGADCLLRLRGFFAFALYDSAAQHLLLVRDPLGKAPLYLLEQPDGICFASDISPLLAFHPAERSRIRPQAVADYLSAGLRDVAHGTFWENIHSLPAATCLKIATKTGQKSQSIYWKLPDNRLTTNELPLDTAIFQFRQHLETAVERRLSADLPVGFTLSGGLDSSALLALACRQSGTEKKWPVLTVRYADRRHDESHFAARVTQQYTSQTEHILLDGGAETLVDELDVFFDLQEEPFHDPVLYTDFAQQRFFKKMGIGVCIMGAGSDELLAGYPAFLAANVRRLWRQDDGKNWPEMAKNIVSIGQNLSFRELAAIARRRYAPANELSWSSFCAVPLPEGAASGQNSNFEAQITQKMGDYLMNYWLRSLNKHYMWHPVEPRLPFLDVDLVDFSMTLPADYLIREGWTKYILRRAVADILPAEIVWRKRKMGFPFDTAAWLRQHELFFKSLIIKDLQNPWIDTRRVVQHYTDLLQYDPQLLWRMVCLSLWHQKIVLQKNLGAP